MKTNKPDYKEMFDRLSDLTLEVYQDIKILFIVPNGRNFMDFVQSVDAQLILYPERHISEEGVSSYEVQQGLVAAIIRKAKQENEGKVIIVTESPVLLSDAFHEQIYWVDEKGSLRECSQPTFGTDPSRIARWIFNLHRSIGALSHQWQDHWLASPPSKDKLETICNKVGGGWPRSKLGQLLDEMK